MISSTTQIPTTLASNETAFSAWFVVLVEYLGLELWLVV